MNCPLLARLCVVAVLMLLTPRPAELSAQSPAAESSPVPYQTVVNLAPENTRIEFVGTHVGDDPKPRLGGFSKFEGMIGVDLDKKQVTSIQVEMQIGSIWTEFDNLTAHLMNPDFFETEKFPSARFKSTKIMTLQNGTCNVAGQLTLHGKTSEVMFPASYKLEESGLVLTAQFFLDRTAFGMDKMTDGVEKMVSINVIVGSPTKSAESASGNGSGKGEQASTETPMPEGTKITIKLPHMT